MKLDVDENVINKKLQIIADKSDENPMSWLNSDIRKNNQKPHKIVMPFPGSCIKTWTESGDKVFINVCHSKELHAPKDISDEELLEQMYLEEPNFIIPMAIGLEKMAMDKEGIERSTFDILISTKYFEKCMKKPCFWKFTIIVILNSINNKYDKSVNTSKYVVLKNCKIMGSLDTFQIEDRQPRKPISKKPLIEVLDEHENDNLQYKSKISKADKIKADNYVIVKSEDEKRLIGYFYLPSSNIKDITVDIGEYRVIVGDIKTNCVIDFFVPHALDNGSSIANYDSKLNILTVILPLIIVR